MKEGGGLFVRIGMMGSEVTAENRPDHRADQRPEKKKRIQGPQIPTPCANPLYELPVVLASFLAVDRERTSPCRVHVLSLARESFGGAQEGSRSGGPPVSRFSALYCAFLRWIPSGFQAAVRRRINTISSLGSVSCSSAG